MRIEIEVQNKGISIEEAKIISDVLGIIKDLPSCKLSIEFDGNPVSVARLGFGEPKFYPEPNFQNGNPIQP